MEGKVGTNSVSYELEVFSDDQVDLGKRNLEESFHVIKVAGKKRFKRFSKMTITRSDVRGCKLMMHNWNQMLTWSWMLPWYPWWNCSDRNIRSRCTLNSHMTKNAVILINSITFTLGNQVKCRWIEGGYSPSACWKFHNLKHHCLLVQHTYKNNQLLKFSETPKITPDFSSRIWNLNSFHKNQRFRSSLLRKW